MASIAVDCRLHYPQGRVIDLQVPGRKIYQEWVVHQPIKTGGLGVMSLVEINPAAYLGALETAIPSFTGEDSICPQLVYGCCD